MSSARWRERAPGGGGARVYQGCYFAHITHRTYQQMLSRMMKALRNEHVCTKVEAPVFVQTGE